MAEIDRIDEILSGAIFNADWPGSRLMSSGGEMKADYRRRAARIRTALETAGYTIVAREDERQEPYKAEDVK